MSRIHQALQRSLQDVVRPAQDIEASPAPMQQCELAANVGLICQGAITEPPFRTTAVDSLPTNGHVPEKDREALTSGAEKSRSTVSRKSSVHELSDEAGQELAKLVQRVFLFPNSSAPRVVVFSSVDKGSGSSEMCFHTGVALARELPGSVCLVDANSEVSSLHHFFEIEKSSGLWDAINSSDPIKNFVTQIASGNLWLLAGGTRPLDTYHRSESQRMRSRLMELRTLFDYVLIDAPPVTSAAKAVLLGQLADGMILVLEANSTRRDTARTAKETIEAARVKLLGAILNNHTPSESLFKRK